MTHTATHNNNPPLQNLSQKRPYEIHKQIHQTSTTNWTESSQYKRNLNSQTQGCITLHHHSFWDYGKVTQGYNEQLRINFMGHKDKTDTMPQTTYTMTYYYKWQCLHIVCEDDTGKMIGPWSL